MKVQEFMFSFTAEELRSSNVKKRFKEIAELFDPDKVLSCRALRAMTGDYFLKLETAEEDFSCQLIDKWGVAKRGGVINDKVRWDHTCPLPK